MSLIRVVNIAVIVHVAILSLLIGGFVVLGTVHLNNGDPTDIPGFFRHLLQNDLKTLLTVAKRSRKYVRLKDFDSIAASRTQSR